MRSEDPPVRATMQEATRELVALGLTEYEARAYAALVRAGESKAEAIHRESGMPRSAVYVTLRRLESRGLVDRTAEDPARFRATPPAVALRRTQDRVDRSAAVALRALNELQRTHRAPPSRSLWVAAGHGAVAHRLPARLASARREILVFGHPTLVERIRDDLEAAAARGVRVAVIRPGGRVPGRRRAGSPASEPAERMVVGIVDGGAVFFGSQDGGAEEFAWSESPVLVHFLMGVFAQLGSPVPVKPRARGGARGRKTGR